MKPEASSLALGTDRRIGQPDLWHEVPAGELGQDPGVDLVGLGRERGQTLDLHGVRNGHVPAPPLELVVNEAGASHRLYGRGHLLALKLDVGGEVRRASASG